MAALLEVDERSARIAGRELFRRCARIGDLVVDVAERVIYAVVKQQLAVLGSSGSRPVHGLRQRSATTAGALCPGCAASASQAAWRLRSTTGRTCAPTEAVR